MRPGAHIAAAVEVLDEILTRHRPAATALADWGKSHRFAGSGDRSAIGNLAYDALRRRRSLAAQMQSDTPRAMALAAAPRALGLSIEAVIAGADGSQYALEPVSEVEQAGLSRALPPDAAPDILGDIPDWLAPSFQRAFGATAAEEGAALAKRAPVDVRANALKADRERVLKALARFSAEPTRYSPVGVRIRAPEGAGRQGRRRTELANVHYPGRRTGHKGFDGRN
jgi:16S rRNA (cytosine967-C5)-methyltransferase